MIKNIIGDKEVFAIEYSISDDHFCLPYDMLYFLWKLQPKAWADFKAVDFPGQMFSSKVPISTYINVTNKFKEAIAKIYPSN